MTFTGNRGVALGALSLILAFTLGAVEAVNNSFERVLTVSEPVELHVRTGSGDISVRAGDSSKVRVKGTVHARGGNAQLIQETLKALEADPPIQQDGNIIRVGDLRNHQFRNNVSISYELIVPAGTSVESKTGSGDQTIDGVAGPLEALTGSGDVKLSNISDEAEIKTGSGDISLDRIGGPVSIATGSGDIEANQIAGAFRATTGSGDVMLEQSAPGDVNFKSGSGDLVASGIHGALSVRAASGDIVLDGEPAGNWSVKTSSGDVRLKMPVEAAFDFEARTISGNLSIDHPLTTQGSRSRRRIQGQVRGGGHLLSVHTVSGSVRVD